MKDNSPNVQMDSMLLHHIHSQSSGVSQPSLKELSTLISCDSEPSDHLDSPKDFRMPTQSNYIAHSQSDVSFLASVSHDNSEYTPQTINLQHPIKEG